MDRRQAALDAPPASKPLWSEEFSVYGAEDKYVLRRQFTKFLVLTSFGMFAGNVWIWAKSLFARSDEQLPELPVAKASEIPVGGVKLFTYPTRKIRRSWYANPTASLSHTARSARICRAPCTTRRHTNRLECPCHEGYFSIDTGRVLQGPPPRPLPRID